MAFEMKRKYRVKVVQKQDSTLYYPQYRLGLWWGFIPSWEWRHYHKGIGGTKVVFSDKLASMLFIKQKMSDDAEFDEWLALTKKAKVTYIAYP